MSTLVGRAAFKARRASRTVLSSLARAAVGEALAGGAAVAASSAAPFCALQPSLSKSALISSIYTRNRRSILVQLKPFIHRQALGETSARTRCMPGTGPPSSFFQHFAVHRCSRSDHPAPTPDRAGLFYRRLLESAAHDKGGHHIKFSGEAQ